jgi:hypothetical protein
VTAKVTAAAKPKKAAAPAKAKSTTTKAKTATKKTTTKAKSAKPAAKHSVPDAHQKHVAHEKVLAARAGFAVGDLLPVCSSQALAQSLRLAGQRVSDDEVLELHYRAGGSADEMVSIGEALAAAALFGLAGCHPVSEEAGPGRMAAVAGLRPGAYVTADRSASGWLPMPPARTAKNSALILHVNVPGPHAVLATRDGWWSWGELYSPWPARVSEAWAVSWS